MKYDNNHWCSRGNHRCEGCEREARINEAVEIARRIIPLVIEAIKQYDEESRK